MVVGSGVGLGSVKLAIALEQARYHGVEVIMLEEAPKPASDYVLTMPEPAAIEKLMMPVVYKPEREWWRGGNPKRRFA